MKQSDRDLEQDQLIRANSERISRNEAAIKRQTEALEKIRDHFYPRKTLWKRMLTFFAKVSCAIFAYLGIAETLDWIWNSRESCALAGRYAAIAKKAFAGEGDAVVAARCYAKAIELDPDESEYRQAIMFMRGLETAADLSFQDRPLTPAERERVKSIRADAAIMRELDPKGLMSNILFAQALVLNGEREDAVAVIDEAVRCNPKDASAHVSACAVKFFAGRHAEARAEIVEAEKLNPSLPLVLFWKGMLALSVDRDAPAAKGFFESMTAHAPRLAIGHVMLGRALLADGTPDVQAARTSFRRAQQLDGTNRFAMLGLAETYERDGDLIISRLWLDRLLANDENSLPALIARARVCGKLGDPVAAAADLTAAIALAPFRSDLYRLRAAACEKTGETARAASDLRIAAALEKREMRIL